MVLKEFSLTLTFCPFLTYITVCEVFGKHTISARFKYSILVSHTTVPVDAVYT